MLINISSYQGITIFRTRGRDGWMEIYIQNSPVLEGLKGYLGSISKPCEVAIVESQNALNMADESREIQYK